MTISARFIDAGDNRVFDRKTKRLLDLSREFVRVWILSQEPAFELRRGVAQPADGHADARHDEVDASKLVVEIGPRAAKNQPHDTGLFVQLEHVRKQVLRLPVPRALAHALAGLLNFCFIFRTYRHLEKPSVGVVASPTVTELPEAQPVSGGEVPQSTGEGS